MNNKVKKIRDERNMIWIFVTINVHCSACLAENLHVSLSLLSILLVYSSSDFRRFFFYIFFIAHAYQKGNWNTNQSTCNNTFSRCATMHSIEMKMRNRTSEANERWTNKLKLEVRMDFVGFDWNSWENGEIVSDFVSFQLFVVYCCS